MALQHCTGCTTTYALGLTACPHCRQPAGGLTVSLPATPRRRPRRAEPPAETGDTEASTDD